MRYPIVVHTDDGSSYGVTVPDLPGCFSGGDTLDMDGQSVPEQRPLQDHQANPDFGGGIWGLVDVDMSKLSSETVRVNITMPARVLAIVDAAATREGESRSGLLTRTALEHIERQTPA